MKNLFLFSAAALLIATSCKEEDQSNPPSGFTPEPRPEEYYPLSVGSYWIYSLHKIDTNGVETDMQQEDSIYISGQRVINGHTYSVFESQEIMPCHNYSMYQRDSAGYLISDYGDIWFAPNDYSDPLRTFVSVPNSTDTLYHFSSRMLKPQNKVTVPAGTFETLALQKSYEIYEIRYLPFRQFTIYRARNVGIVSYQCGNLHDPATYEFRLERYHIN